ncbi:lipase family protein [Pantoea sp. Cy-639]|nr:lipase family protein [Pantoea sp. Cy-639]
MTMLEKQLAHPLSDRVYACPFQGQWTSFQLVDEFGEGQPYAGLSYEVVDAEGHTYQGRLDSMGVGKVNGHFAGPVVVIILDEYKGQELTYLRRMQRTSYPLPITELQVRAEQTRHLHKDGSRTQDNPAQACADAFYQVEVRDFVNHVAHLPPKVDAKYPPLEGLRRLMRKSGEQGVCLLPNRHNVLEVRPLRALCPVLSTDSQFCALNLYQLAIMATLSYNPFGQEPDEIPVQENVVTFEQAPSVGNWFGDALAKFDEIWKADAGQIKAFYPLYEDVPYSKRLEVVPFDPVLYPANNPELGSDQETPGSIHFLDDRDQDYSTDTQAFVTHNDEVIVIAVRGTSEGPDFLRDADAYQVPFQEGAGKVHRGFYEAAQRVYGFALQYLQKFYIGQKLIMCGHSLGGAIALLASEMLRRQKIYKLDIVLYTYGSPRAADATFVKEAADLTHYRMVNHNDPIPSVPGTWLNSKSKVYGFGAVVSFVNVPAGLSLFAAGITNLTGEPYEHHGTLHHFLPVDFGGQAPSSVLWQPGCDTITQHAACALAVQQVNGLPDRPGLIAQAFHFDNHSMVGSYIPASWATLRRWQEALALERPKITDAEFSALDGQLKNVKDQLQYRIRSQRGRPSKYVEAHEQALDAFQREVYKIGATLERMQTLRWARVQGADVYGSLSRQAEVLAQSLKRWDAHPENKAVEQLAKAPLPAINDEEAFAAILGHPGGASRPLDIDSIIQG